jgi:hypothetical protein
MEGCFPRGLVPVGATIDSYPLDTKTRIACGPFRLSVRLARAGATRIAWVLFGLATRIRRVSQD